MQQVAQQADVAAAAAVVAGLTSSSQPQSSAPNAADSPSTIDISQQQPEQQVARSQSAGNDDVDMADPAIKGRRGAESDEGEGEGGGLTLEQELAAEYGASSMEVTQVNASSSGTLGNNDQQPTTTANVQQPGEAGNSQGTSDSAPKRWNMQCEGLEEMGQPGKLHPRMFRTIESFTVDDPGPLVPGEGSEHTWELQHSL
jgi:hypothetical protein